MARAAAVPILTWHAMNVAGQGYGDNDHAAFASDLETLHRLGLRVVSLRAIATALVEGRLDTLKGCVGLSFDDGSDFDWHDLPHPAWGVQRSMANILRDFRARHGAGAQPRLHATSFTIVSPEARAELDRTCMIGCRWWNDDWWREAEASGLLAVESHSWDHNHDSLAATAACAPRGAFDLATRGDADAQIARASRVLKARRGRDDDVLFAFPYGPGSDYLVNEYLPDASADHGVHAAFTGDGAPVSAGLSRWRLPRYVIRNDWNSPGELERLLRDAFGVVPGKRRASDSPGVPEVTPLDWRACLRTYEVHEARVLAGELFQKSFGHVIPDYPKHFVLVYSPPAGSAEAPRIVAYVHFSPYEEVFLGGGMCADPGAYRAFPKPLFDVVKREGGLATIVTRDALGMLGDSPAAFGHVGEPRARQADLRTGFVDTGRPHIMAYWRRALPDAEKQRLLDKVEKIGPF